MGREEGSEGVLRTYLLAAIRFFRPSNHFTAQELLVKVTLPAFLSHLGLSSMLLSTSTIFDFLALASDLLATAGRKMGAQESKISSINSDKLGIDLSTYSSLIYS